MKERQLAGWIIRAAGLVLIVTFTAWHSTSGIDFVGRLVADVFETLPLVLLVMISYYQGRRFQWRLNRAGSHEQPRFFRMSPEERSALARERTA